MFHLCYETEYKEFTIKTEKVSSLDMIDFVFLFKKAMSIYEIYLYEENS